MKTLRAGLLGLGEEPTTHSYRQKPQSWEGEPGCGFSTLV